MTQVRLQLEGTEEEERAEEDGRELKEPGSWGPGQSLVPGTIAQLRGTTVDGYVLQMQW